MAASTNGTRGVLALPTNGSLSAVCQLLEESGYLVVRFSPTADATELMRLRPLVVVLDISPEYREPAMRTVQDLRHRERRLPIVLVGDDTSSTMVIRALRAGARDFYPSPYSPPEVSAAICKCAIDAVSRLAVVAPGRSPLSPMMVGTSVSARTLLTTIDALAEHDSTVLVTGETGTGKELVAQTIHSRSHRHARPFVTVSCPAVPDTLLESELFGHERGAFTGAHGPNQGKLAAAGGGTVFFDEIGDMTLSGQAKILGAIETRQVVRLGAHRPVPLDVRFIAATNADLDGMIADGRFRRDLYYRLNVARVRLPPLRERREDIPPLLDHYAHQFAGVYKRDLRFANETVQRLSAYTWPGNIRELRNLVEAMFASGHRGMVTLRDLTSQFDRLLRTADDEERQRVLGTMRACNWNKSKAAEQLHWSRMTLYRRLRKYRIGLGSSDTRTDEQTPDG